jgi:hypothetical protein
MNVRVFDLDQMRDNLNSLNNDPVKLEQLKKDKLPVPKNVGMTYGKVLEALGLYFENLNQSVPVPSDKLFADKYFNGDMTKGKYFRDLLYIIRDIPQDKVPMSEMYNLPPIQSTFTSRTGEKAKRKEVPGREEKRRPGGTNTIANVRLDRITGIKPAPKGENFPIDYRQHAFNKAQGNFQPADTIAETLGTGTVITDKRTGWRMVSKDGRSQRLYRPDGTLHGIYSSADEAKIVLNKLTLKDAEKQMRFQPIDPLVVDQSYFKNPNKFYRVIHGKESFNDIVSSGVVRTNYDTKPKSNLGISLANRPTKFPSFSKGEASMSYAQSNPEHYIIETEDPSIKPSTRGRHGAGTTMFPTDEFGNEMTSIDASKVKIYQHVGDGKYQLIQLPK